MASPLVGRTPTCLSCIRRINQVASSSIAITQQIRGKKTKGKPKKLGVVIRLLQDLEKYGKEGAIMRARPGIMRNDFYPKSIAEYMTPQRLKALGLSKDDIGERDTQYGLNRQLQEEDIEDAVEHIAGSAAVPGSGASTSGVEASGAVPAMEIEQLPPNRALELLEALIPETIVFERYTIHQTPRKKTEPEAAPEPQKTEESPEPQKPAPVEARREAPRKPEEILSPMQRRRLEKQAAEVEKASLRPEAAAAEVNADKDKDKPAASPLDTAPGEEKTADEVERERKQMEKDAEELLKIHGSVSLGNIASYLKEKMLLDPEASRIQVQPEEIRFVGLEQGVDQVKKVGSFEVEIRTHVGKSPVEPVRRRVEVVPI
ncbi:unnamed protein product [Discula destructiva]